MTPALETLECEDGISKGRCTPAQKAPTAIELLLLPQPSIVLIEVEYGYRPRESFGLSLLIHTFALLLLIPLGRHIMLRPSITLASARTTYSSSSIFLPTLGGGSEGGGKQGGGLHKDRGHLSAGLRARSRRGFAYPGPQPMLSNPKKASLGTLTLLQPSLKNLPRLRHDVELPNIVQPPTTASRKESKAPALVIKNKKQSISVRQRQKHERRRHDVASQGRAIAGPEKPLEIPSATRHPKGLLALNAIPPPPDVRSLVPRAEARSLFAVVPSDTTIIAAPAAGNVSGEQFAAPAGNGARTDVQNGDALAEGAARETNATSSAGESGSGSGGGLGDGKGPGINTESRGTGTGRGSGMSSGLGTGSAPGTGSGNGGGSAPGSGHFAGITIQGGRYGNSTTSLLEHSSPRQTSYGTTVVSTASSGGGLPDIGFFHNEKVYTVYLDMRSSDDDQAPSWTLQYSLFQLRTLHGGVAVSGTPSPPYVTLRQVPEFSPEQLHQRRLILVSAVLDVTGKLVDVTVRQGSDDALNSSLVEALKNWMFQPAEIAGHPVALKVLLGIRLAAPHSHS